MNSPPVSVRIFHSWAALEPHRPALDRIQRESPRPSPFSTLAYGEACLAVAPSLRPAVPWICVAFEGGSPIGYLALRCLPDRSAGWPSHRLEHLSTLGVDRPHLVARGEDEARCAEVVLRELTHTPGWSLLQLTQQDASSALRPPGHRLPPRQCYVRELDDRQTSSLPITWGSLADYVAALSGRHRSHVKRMTLDTLATGTMSLVRSSQPEALPALLELYLSAERRSWKGRGEASMGGSPWREALTRRMLAGASPMALTIEILLDGDLPIGGTITGDHQGSVYFLYTAFDDAYAAVSPGVPLLLFAIQRAIEGGFAAFHMLPDYAYYKRRWLAEVTDTTTIQIYRTLTALHLKARLGEAHRRLSRGLATPLEGFNPARRATGEDSQDDAETGRGGAPASGRSEAISHHRAQIAQVLALEGVLARSAEQLLRATPFANAPRRKASPRTGESDQRPR